MSTSKLLFVSDKLLKSSAETEEIEMIDIINKKASINILLLIFSPPIKILLKNVCIHSTFIGFVLDYL
ncbi:hypothetical protein [Methanobrevibacter boviskoreani]|uniref:hypothetical protein n=1 Tax=Methanobrevibacter boviskoreani TaxID=1348249 RepID=UPI0023F10AAE|nr:hypothetical protein [Methanobrevibacter boviskoreani]MDD6256590.1 hypothetical protein [Methanobrevibacter boviskoreani]